MENKNLSNAVQDMEILFTKAKNAYYHSATDEALVDVRNMFLSLGDYKNSPEFVKKCDRLLEFQEGRTVAFGSYNGLPIRWKVLQAKGKNHLLFAENVVTGYAFNEERTNMYWSKCTLRKWLNRDFINEAFTPAERMSIVFTKTFNEANMSWSTPCGPETRDKIFVFSHKELLEYLPNQADRALGEWWWTRTMGHCALSAVSVYIDGTIYDIGLNIVDHEIGVRPAMWVMLKR